MPDQDFSVKIDPEQLDLSAFRTPRPGSASPPAKPAGAAAHHGAHDDRQQARSRSGRARAGRAAGTGAGRSYAFRRS